MDAVPADMISEEEQGSGRLDKNRKRKASHDSTSEALPSKKRKPQPPCEHGKNKYYCKMCKMSGQGGSKLCEHSKEKRCCKQCGTRRPPQKRCQHGKQKNICKDCKILNQGGASLCGHFKEKRYCKLCSKSRPRCEHNKQKQWCKVCSPQNFCQHDQNKYMCKKCPNASCICPHGRQKQRCKKCSGSSYCGHGVLRYFCQDCAGLGSCIHKANKSRCQLCAGRGLCSHGRVHCKQCKRGTCKHGLWKSACIECYPQYFCEHSKLKRFCTLCEGSRTCASCHKFSVDKKGDFCSYCNPQAKKRSRIKEASVVAQLEEWAGESKIPPYTSWNKVNVLSDPEQCGQYRVDIVYNQDVFVLALEVDENQHKFYERDCELVRQAKIALSYGGKPVRFVRYNPDGFQVGGMTRRTMKEERMRTLLGTLQEIFGDASWIYQDEKQESMYFMIVDYLFYDPILPGSAGGLVQTFKFATVEDYEAWAEMLAPGVAEDDGGIFSFLLKRYFVKSKQKHSSRHFCCWR